MKQQLPPHSKHARVKVRKQKRRENEIRLERGKRKLKRLHEINLAKQEAAALRKAQARVERIKKKNADIKKSIGQSVAQRVKNAVSRATKDQG